MKTYDNLIIKYFDDQLTADERIAFEKELEINSSLKNSFMEFKKVHDTFSKKDDIQSNDEYFNTIIPRFRNSLDKKVNIIPVGKLGFAIATIVFLLTAYVIFQNVIFRNDYVDDSLKLMTENLSGEEINEIADYISDDYQTLLSSSEMYKSLEDIDYSLEEIAANVTSEEKLLILSDYGINDIYSLANENELENAYNEILSKRIF